MPATTHRYHRRARLAALIIAAGALTTAHATPAKPTAATTAAPIAATAAKPLTIKVGYLAQLQDVALLTMQDRLKDRHKVELVRYPRYADAEAALGRGDIQLASLGYEVLAGAVARGGAPKFTYVAGLSRGAVGLVCRNEVLIDAWPDIKGKRIGVVAGLPEVFLDDALVQHALQLTDFERVKFPTKGTPALQALREGAVQCASMPEPQGATAVAEGYAYYPRTDIADNAYGGINNGLAANPAFLKANRSAVLDLVKEVLEVTAVYQRDKNAWIQELASAQAVAGAASGVGIERVLLDTKLYMDEAWSLVVALRPPTPTMTTNPPSAAGAAAIAAITKPLPERDAMNVYFDTTLTEKP
ncbi:ABC transporter substrate-binding protein [Pigmentiphaga aceris]|uniref:ABC transporter substrate-binding protein n=1 Tax=Pigmentiphaga aceris TaxID=1940612 RepID=A0A5C0AQX2_9BURK|nr:ABC transporter substrate-binding protein [Pigmentiphaga aceris]QEI04428.1 ABC transporter substrate-binding protein [Pigmentiphaga aceris]